jgi:methylated-DNA-protein-cysteine methyltransferase related protein
LFLKHGKIEKMKSLSVAQGVYEIVAQIPKGKVLTYGSIAKALGLKTPRQVGWILHRNDDSQNVPCHRVIFSDGNVSGNYAFGGADAQRKWLQSEGVEFTPAGKVNLKQALWDLQ